MHAYTRAVFYYETDQMGFVHHSNYLRWMEEARTDYLQVAGLPYEIFEAHGVMSPVVGANLRYRAPARFGDRVTVRLRMTHYDGVRFSFAYAFFNQEERLLAEASSDHAFITKTGRPVSLAKHQPAMHETLASYVERDPQ